MKKQGFFDQAWGGTIYRAMLFGALLGGFGLLAQGKDIARAFGGAMGGAILFAIFWSIVRFVRRV